ncbi:MAG: GAF domain-containing protein [Gomphosphaeria aponina SAG 52.96 = DSM 107014]|uniref:GAF domain-containing protein n=1 Tax=Gomphosphaeria aponina SAG 52.96 = DSM 107014 TaxID=1521640 RepID=A0A941GSY2_9CHRO|nr:GAF domain-containing protein [Gomphosphaeria aponina SAG 52.96 = DSM 107014]
MTQTTPKPKYEVTENIKNRTREIEQEALVIEEIPEPINPLLVKWQNLNIKRKLGTILFFTTAIPIIGVTIGTVISTQEQSIKTLEQVLDRDLVILEDKIEQEKDNIEAEAEAIARLIENGSIKKNEGEIKAHLNQAGNRENYSFYLVTNAQGETIAQDLKIVLIDEENYSSLSATTQLSPLQLPLGIKLGDIPIVQRAIKEQTGLKGIELFRGEIVERLGLGKQANIGVRTQEIEGLPEAQQPYAEGTFDIDGGKAGLVMIAVEPIKINGKIEGTVIVGNLINRNYEIVDLVREKTEVPTATIFAQDWRVSTNVPYTDGKTRAIGTRVSREVAQVVLNEGQEFIGTTNIIGIKYLTAYRPIYNHEGKIIGISYVGIPLTEVNRNLRQIAIIAVVIGLVIILLTLLLLIIPIANSFSAPIKRLANFVQRVGKGQEGIRLARSDRQDEIGILSQEINKMVANLEAKENIFRQESKQARLLAEISGSRVLNNQELQQIFNQALEETRKLLLADRVVVYRFNSDYSGYISNESVMPGWPVALNDRIEDACIPDTILKEYINGRVVPTNDVFNAGFHPDHEQLMVRLKIKANLVVPILNQGQLYGLLIAHHCQNTHEWVEREINFLVQLAAQFGVILERVTFIKQQEKQALRSEQLKEIILKIADSLTVEEVWKTAVNEMRAALKTNRVIVYSFDENYSGTIIAESVGDSWPVAMGATITDPCFADKYVEKYQAGRVQATADIYQAGLTECHLRQLEPFAVKANLVAPITIGGKLFGLLIAHQCDRPRNWESGEIQFFAQIATQIGLAKERVTLLENQQKAEAEQRQAKEKLQRRALELLIEVDPISKGDLTIRTSVKEDEIGTIADSYNTIVESLRKIVIEVQEAAEQVAETTNTNEEAVVNLSIEAKLQSREITEALEQLQAMTNSIASVASAAEEAEAVVEEAAGSVEAGDAAITQTVKGILGLRETVIETVEKVKQLGESSQDIAKVVNLIGRFAAQTHLLALKASIEAARAGEEGQGFAVIADEVRSLAAQSSEATISIEKVVNNILAETKAVVVAMEAGKMQVEEGTEMVEQTRQNLNQITAASARINELVAAIANAAFEQSVSSAAVTETMTNVAAISDRTSASASDVAASFKDLLAVAVRLKTDVAKFKVD